MRLSQLLTTHTRADDQADLLARAGYTHQLADGVYTLLPLGRRVLARIAALVRDELERAGAQEVCMPLLQPEQLWQRALGGGPTRAAAFGAQLFRLRNSSETGWVLAPTHEEVAAVIGAACIRDARDLPRVLFQIQPRFRDQASPGGAGLLHTREFVMADAYGFHADRAGLEASYFAIRDALCSAARRCGVDVELVAADCGAIGGDGSEELLAGLPGAATTGVRCSACGYAASLEIAECTQRRSAPAAHEAPLPRAELAVPDGLALEASAALLDVAPAKRLIALAFVAGARVILAVIAGERPLNLSKLGRALARAGVDPTDLHPASARELHALGASYGWVSLVETPGSVLVVADEAVRAGANFVLPSTRSGHFLVNVNSGRDFRVDLYAELGVADDGDGCPRCGRELRAIRGLEVGHVFKLGTRFAAEFGAQVVVAGELRPLQMGCYGLGLTRLMGAIAEQRRDARGLVWPEPIAPYAAVILAGADLGARSRAEQLYRELVGTGADVLLDDSSATLDDARAHADLLGIPLQLVASGARGDATPVELRERATRTQRRVAAGQVAPLLHARSRA